MSQLSNRQIEELKVVVFLASYISKSLKAIDGPYSNQIKAIIKKEIKVLMYSIINNLYFRPDQNHKG